MRILFLGDIVARGGRDAVCEHVPILRKKYKLDAVIVNGENAAHGIGITSQISKDLFDSGVDCITTGNHIWDQREIIPYIEGEHRLIRPANFPKGTPGRGSYIIHTARGDKILVVNMMAQLFMSSHLDNPFAAMEALLKEYQLGHHVQAIVLDFHGEATSEKQAMGFFCDGRASFVVGTHTHIPTSDLRILPKGTAYQTDAGMCGNYDTVIGVDKDIVIAKFVRKVPGERFRPMEGPVSLSGAIIEINNKTGLAEKTYPLRMGGSLSESIPQIDL